jgi:hypothetical protein
MHPSRSTTVRWYPKRSSQKARSSAAVDQTGEGRDRGRFEAEDAWTETCPEGTTFLEEGDFGRCESPFGADGE